MVWHNQITKNWMYCTRSTRIKVCHFTQGEKKKEIYVNYTLWDCEFCNTDTCEFSLGLEILAFPCNQFAGQEPGTNDEIQEVACTRLKAEFPIFDKVIYDKYIVTYKSLFFRCRIWSSLLCSLFIICLLFYLDLTCCK